MKKIGTAFWGMILCLVLSSCGYESSDANSEIVSVTETENIEVSVSEENTDIVDEQKLADESNSNLISILDKYCFQDGEIEDDEYYKFDSFTKDIQSLAAEGNTSAQSMLEKAQTVDYSAMTEDQKVVFDTYMEIMCAYIPSGPGKVVEVWYGSGETSKGVQLGYYLLKFEEVADDNSYVYVKLAPSVNYEYKELHQNVYKGEEALTEYSVKLYEREGEMFLENIEKKGYGFFVNELNADELNSVIDNNQDFLAFMETYCTDVYAPVLEERRENEIAARKEAEEEKEEWASKIPEVGMTADEVKKTSWGSPDKINKDTYSWGVEEQWVYDDKGYVYLEDGIVTSVSER